MTITVSGQPHSPPGSSTAATGLPRLNLVSVVGIWMSTTRSMRESVVRRSVWAVNTAWSCSVSCRLTLEIQLCRHFLLRVLYFQHGHALAFVELGTMNRRNGNQASSIPLTNRTLIALSCNCTRIIHQ